ncbi:MAG: YceI family protein [Acidobacteriaceae bacterium]
MKSRFRRVYDGGLARPFEKEEESTVIRKRQIRLGMLALVAMLSVTAQAQKVTVQLDPNQTMIRWTLTDVLHTVHGIFKMKQGVVSYDPQTGAADGLIVIDAASGYSGNSMRDGRMHKEFLEVQKYPEITFHPQSVEGGADLNAALAGARPIKVNGIFSLHGADHSFSMILILHGNSHALTATTHFDVPYVAWGIKDPSTLMLRVSKQVQIDVTGVGVVQK